MGLKGIVELWQYCLDRKNNKFKMSKILPVELGKNQDNHLETKNDDRFYYIRVRQIDDISPTLIDDSLKTTNMKLSFQISTKKSQTQFQNSYGKVYPKEMKRLKNQAHFFCFEAEEIMIVTLSQVGNKKIKGYSNILLTPFMELPHTRHSITVNMVFQERDKQIQKQISAILEIDLYFLFQFEAKLELTPLEANIVNNTSSIGLMQPCIIFTINEQRKKSLTVEKGGIHPNWVQFSEKRKKIILEKQGFTESIIVEDEQVQNCFSFDLNSVGHELKIQMVSYPFIGEDVRLIGETVIRIESLGFFRRPNCVEMYSGKNSIKLYYIDPETKEEKQAGKLQLKSKFIYDIVKIRKQIDSESEESDDE